MKRQLTLLALASLASSASVQNPYPAYEVYAKAQRQQHPRVRDVAFTTEQEGDYDLFPNQENFFNVDGSIAQGSLPWGLTWQSLCDNTWHYSTEWKRHVAAHMTVTQYNDYYTIDHSYVDPTTGDPDQSNGDDVIVNDAPPPRTGTWIRTCTSQVTNEITMEVTASV